MPQTGLLTYSPQRLYHELLFLSHAALRTSTAPPLLSKYYPYPPALCFFSGRRLRHQLLFSLCGFTNMPQTGLLTYSPQRLYHKLLFLSHAALRTSTAPPLLSKYYPYPDCTLFFSSGQRLGYELLFCPVRLYGLQPLRNSFQSIILIRLHSVFSSGRRLRHHCFFPMRLCGHAPDRPFDVFPSATVSQIAFLVTCGFTDFNRSATPFKVLSLSACTLFFLRVRGSVTNCFFALCGNTNKHQTGLFDVYCS